MLKGKIGLLASVLLVTTSVGAMAQSSGSGTMSNNGSAAQSSGNATGTEAVTGKHNDTPADQNNQPAPGASTTPAAPTNGMR